MSAEIKILFDTDIGCDCDDAGAMAVLHELANRGECEILAVTHCCAGPYNAGCIDAINRYFGRPDLPVGVFHPEDHVATQWKDVYARAVAERFPNRFPPEAACPGTLEVLRRALAEAKDGEVIFVVTGSMYSMARLVESGPDEISSFSGRELIRRKIRRTVVMGGRFHSQWPQPIVLDGNDRVDAEFNILCDISSARKVCSRWPGELVFCSYEIGLALHTGVELQTRGCPENPVRASYALWGAQNGETGRESWDLTAMLYAIRPDAGYWTLHEPGWVRISEDGVTSLEPAPDGRHTFLIECAPVEEVRQALDRLLDADALRRRPGAFPNFRQTI